MRRKFHRKCAQTVDPIAIADFFHRTQSKISAIYIMHNYIKQKYEQTIQF